MKNKKRLKFLLSPSKSSATGLFQRWNERSKEEYVLSHMQQIHLIQFDGQELSVNKYVKKHISTAKPIEYKYASRFVFINNIFNAILMLSYV